jgi:hypothetical protein
VGVAVPGVDGLLHHQLFQGPQPLLTVPISERILGSESALWVSPSLEWMVFATINCSRVATLSFPHILLWDDSAADLTVKFPKVRKIVYRYLDYAVDFIRKI